MLRLSNVNVNAKVLLMEREHLYPVLHKHLNYVFSILFTHINHSFLYKRMVHQIYQIHISWYISCASLVDCFKVTKQQNKNMTCVNQTHINKSLKTQ